MYASIETVATEGRHLHGGRASLIQREPSNLLTSSSL
jgi:hypothetical protein